MQRKTLRSITAARFKFVLFGLITLFFSSSAWSASLIPFEHYRDDYGRGRLIPEFMMLSSSQNFNQAGTKVKPDSAGDQLTSYSLNLVNLVGSYGISPTMTVYGRLQYVKANYKTGLLNGNGSGLRDQTLGVTARVWKNKETLSAFDVQIELLFPTYDPVNQRAAGQMLYGDGTRNLTVAGFYILPFEMRSDRQKYMEIGLGYTNRNLGFSAFIPYRADFISRTTQEGWGFRAGLIGIQSAKSDPVTEPPSSALATNAVHADAGSSLMVNALNSSYTAVHGALAYRFNPQSELRGTVATTVRGKSTAAWSQIGAQLEYRFGSTPSQNANPQKSQKTYGLTGRVKQVNEQLSILRVSVGEDDGVELGNLFAIFNVREDGSPQELVAIATVTHLRETESVLKIKHFQKQVLIEPGFVVKRLETDEQKF